MQRLIFIVCFLFLSISSVSAHPGHGSPDSQEGLRHFLTSPIHSGPIVAAAGAALLLAVLKMRKSKH